MSKSLTVTRKGRSRYEERDQAILENACYFYWGEEKGKKVILQYEGKVGIQEARGECLNFDDPTPTREGSEDDRTEVKLEKKCRKLRKETRP